MRQFSRQQQTSMVIALALAAALGAGGCGGGSMMAQRPQDPRVDDAVTQLWADDIRRVAQDGDWILTRSYSAAGDAIVVLTPGEELSHASVYAAETDTVIEAITPVVREIPLAKLLARNRYAIVVRPGKLASFHGAAVVERARRRLGAKFDVAGMVGLDDDAAVYCSELAYWAAGVGLNDPAQPNVILPSDLIAYGEVVYFSGRRDDPQMQRAAVGWLDEHDPRVAQAFAARGVALQRSGDQ